MSKAQRLCFTLCGTLFVLSAVHAQETLALPKTTYVYKTVGDTKVGADVYRPADTKVRPVVVWLHGGALILGNRGQVPPHLLALCKAEGYALVSLDYRLAPEVKSPEIVADVEDAFRWIRNEGAKAAHLDPDRIVVVGASAGGHLALAAGHRVKPRVRAIVDFYGYGDVDGDWLSKPSEFHRTAGPLVSKEDALKGVSDRVLTGSEPAFDSKARSAYYRYLRQNGLWTKTVTGFDPATDSAKLDALCPIRNVTPDYPPTLLIHGTADGDVPYEKSLDMVKAFEKNKVPRELITIKDGNHGFGNVDKAVVDAANAKAAAFIREHMKK